MSLLSPKISLRRRSAAFFIVAGFVGGLFGTVHPLCAAEPSPPHAAPPPNMESYQLVLLRRGAAWTKEATPAIEKLQAEHIGHLRKMAESGKLLVAGPLSDQPDEGLRGICIYKVQSLAEARQLAEADPMVRAGRLRVEVMTWWTEKGALSFPKALTMTTTPTTKQQ